MGIVGESGSGKSTIGRAVLQLIKPTAGRVAWLGKNIAGNTRRQMKPFRREMQIVFQDPLASLNPRMTAGDIIAEPLDTFEPGLAPAERKRRVQEIMDKVGLLPQMINRYPHEFSGGQNQRIGIARAMILKPKLIVADEPVSSLDVSIRAQIINLLADLQKEIGVALIFISHDLAVVRHVSHRVLVLYLGKVMELGGGGRSAVAAASSLYASAAVGGAGSRSRGRARQEAASDRRRPALADQSAVRLRVPHALSDRASEMREGSARARSARRSGGSRRRLPLPDRESLRYLTRRTFTMPVRSLKFSE